jgi:hypothetical protein
LQLGVGELAGKGKCYSGDDRGSSELNSHVSTSVILL